MNKKTYRLSLHYLYINCIYLLSLTNAAETSLLRLIVRLLDTITFTKYYK